jgi:nitroimidazol reductase NimA-like FMN-containing flavoprotein (pyridoxamine 5'-phosphate oxidase superfamily)
MASPRMTDDEIWEMVTDAHTGIMTTLRRDGVPIALPVWFVCLDRRLYVRTRGKKLLRIAHDPRSSFLVETGERWADLQAVHLTGVAEIVDLDAELAGRFRDEMDRKYAAFRTEAAAMPQATAEHYAATMNGVVRFTPDARVLNWDNRKLVP